MLYDNAYINRFGGLSAADARIKNITSKILKDAEAGKENILATAEEEKNKILAYMS